MLENTLNKRESYILKVLSGDLFCKETMIVSGLVLLLLAGCDESDADRAGVAGQALKQASERGDRTAIYLRSGVVLDFGRKPIVHRAVVQKSGKYRQVTCLFDEYPAVIYKSIEVGFRSVVASAR